MEKEEIGSDVKKIGRAAQDLKNIVLSERRVRAA